MVFVLCLSTFYNFHLRLRSSRTIYYAEYPIKKHVVYHTRPETSDTHAQMTTANETKNMSHNTLNYRDFIMKTGLKPRLPP